MQFSDTSTKQGLIQDCEFWTGLGDATISGTPATLALFTRLINVRYAKTLGKIQLLSGRDGAEDTNYTKQQFATFTFQSGQNDYQFLTDADGNTISDITGVAIQSSGSSDFVQLDRLNLSDDNALLIMSPNTSNVGTPTGFIEKNNTVFFNVIPNYSASGKLFYRLVPSYFVAGDTTKKAGFVENFDRILSVGASLDWLSVNKPDQTNLLTLCRAELNDLTNDLEAYVRQKNPTQIRMTGARHSSR